MNLSSLSQVEFITTVVNAGTLLWHASAHKYFKRFNFLFFKVHNLVMYAGKFVVLFSKLLPNMNRKFNLEFNFLL